MTNLQCNVINCSNNKDNCCCRPDIQVNGPCACGSEQTSCSSFVDATSSAENSTGYSMPNIALDISCDAKNCTYNKQEKCCADHISVSSEGANPDTSSKTECASFENR
jgi:hypothetical protein